VTYDERAIIEALDALSPARRVAFAATVAERMLPAFSAYSGATRQDSGVLTSIMDRLWRDLDGDALTAADVRDALARCMERLPDEDALGWTPARTYADDACAALAYALRARLSGSSQEAAWAARRAYESVDHFAQAEHGIDPADPAAEARLLATSVVQDELRRQRRDLAELTGSETDAELFRRLRARARSESARFLGDDRSDPAVP
jgi:uncharacterized protein YjaG (DUF416 family)